MKQASPSHQSLPASQVERAGARSMDVPHCKHLQLIIMQLDERAWILHLGSVLRTSLNTSEMI